MEVWISEQAPGTIKRLDQVPCGGERGAGSTCGPGDSRTRFGRGDNWEHTWPADVGPDSLVAHGATSMIFIFPALGTDPLVSADP